MFNNSLTRVPEQIRLFPRLVRISLATNKLRTIERSVYFPPTIEVMEHIGLDYQSELEDIDNHLSKIEPGAFQCELLFLKIRVPPIINNYYISTIGNFGIESTIQLTRNKLTRFDSNVFHFILEEMNRYGGQIDINES
jgi:hypothetical protein